MLGKINESKESIGGILKEFCNELENDPKGLENALLDYSQVIGTTAQGSSKKNVVSEFKGDADYYDAVIVDEAARVIPLDLMIPLSKAKKFILVGDDNQLPHLLDSEIERDLIISSDEIYKEYKESLFSKLKEVAQKDHYSMA